MYRRTGGDVQMQEGRDVWWHEVVEGESDDPSTCPCEPMDSEDLLYLLYTSGTTAKPKGIVHTTAGYLVGVAATHHYIFDIKPDSVYWCAADVGWVTGHSYIVYGPLCNGTTGVIYEGVPNYPDKDRWWAIVERYDVDILYTAPTAIRTHMKWGPEHAKQHDLSSLRLLGSVGEPINPEAWVWYREQIGADNVPVVDTWWQTETGMIMITPLPGVTTLKPGSATKPFPGVDAAVYDEEGKEVGPGGGGYLVLRRPWPAMLRGIYKDDDRYLETYWSKYEDIYFAGDGARIDEDGDFWLLGRVDDVMNVSGHRISTIEVESALVDHQGVAEAAVAAGGTSSQARRSSPTSRSRAATRALSRCSRSCATTWPARSGRSPSRRTSCSRRSCRRRGAARSCAACSATWPSTAHSAIRRPSPTPRSSRRSKTRATSGDTEEG